MPYEIDGKCVYKVTDDGRETVKCHETEEAAQAHLAALKANVDHDEKAAQDAAQRRSIRQIVVDTLNDILGAAGLDGRKQTTFNAFKAYGNHWFAAWTNNFEDRDGEFFSSKAIDDYIARVDSGLVPPPELWLFHTPGSRIGQAKAVGRIGHFAVAWGEFDDTPRGIAARAYFKQHPQQGVSHGFTFDPAAFKDRVYHQFNTFELSPLPERWAANTYATFEGVKNMGLSEDKRAYLADVLGEDEAARVIAGYEDKSKALAELVTFKQFDTPTDATETPAVEQAAKQAGNTFAQVLPELMEGSADAVEAARDAVKAVKALNKRLDALEQENKALRDELRLAPRASQASETELSDGVLAAQLEKMLKEKQAGQVDPIYGLPKES